jgi:hypothetical protein
MSPIPFEVLPEINLESKIINILLDEPKFNSCSNWERIIVYYGEKVRKFRGQSNLNIKAFKIN